MGESATREVSTPEAAALDALAAERFTCRAYRPDPVPEATIRSILGVARRTASWCNVQPWQVVVTAGASTEAFRRALVARAEADPDGAPDIPFPPGYEGLYRARRQEVGHQLYAALGIERGDRARRLAQMLENFRLFGAPHVAIVTVAAELGPYALADCGGFVATFLLAARAHGVDTTPQAALATQSGLIRRHFGIAEGQDVLCGIAFGYADRDHPANGYRTARASVDEIARIV